MGSDDEEGKAKKKYLKFPEATLVSKGKYRKRRKPKTPTEFSNSGSSSAESLTGRAKSSTSLAMSPEAKENEHLLRNIEISFLNSHREYAARLIREAQKKGERGKAADNSLQPDIPMALEGEDVDDIASKLESVFCEFRPPKFKPCENRSTPESLEFVASLLEGDLDGSAHPYCHFVKSYLKGRQIPPMTLNPTKTGRAGLSPTGKKSKVEVARVATVMPTLLLPREPKQTMRQKKNYDWKEFSTKGIISEDESEGETVERYLFK